VNCWRRRGRCHYGLEQVAAGRDGPRSELLRFAFLADDFTPDDGFARSQSRATQFALAFEFPLSLRRKARPGDRLQPRRRDPFAGQLADAVGAVPNPVKRLLNFINRILLRREHAEGEVAVILVCPSVRHVRSESWFLFQCCPGEAGALVKQ